MPRSQPLREAIRAGDHDDVLDEKAEEESMEDVADGLIATILAPSLTVVPGTWRATSGGLRDFGGYVGGSESLATIAISVPFMGWGDAVTDILADSHEQAASGAAVVGTSVVAYVPVDGRDAATVRADGEALAGRIEVLLGQAAEVITAHNDKITETVTRWLTERASYRAGEAAILAVLTDR